MPINGSSLSAGEKQLVAIARAILRRTNIVIMDEATSQIDSVLDDQVRINHEILKIRLIFLADTKSNPGRVFGRDCSDHRPPFEDDRGL